MLVGILQTAQLGLDGGNNEKAPLAQGLRGIEVEVLRASECVRELERGVILPTAPMAPRGGLLSTTGD